MIVDLSHVLHEGMPVYPGTPSPSFVPSNTIREHGFAELSVTMCTHTGTHIDAPCHILPDTRSLDRFPVDHFSGTGTLVDARGRPRLDLDLLRDAEARISKSEFVLFHTGWQERWNTAHYFDGYPTLTPEALRWLVSFPLQAVGFDTVSADCVDDADLPNHHELLSREILIIENLANLDALPGGLFTFHCFPMRIANADGSPIRAVASF